MAEVTRSQQILDAAAVVFSNTGYHRARIEDIAARAGIGKGTVYEYFESKRQLYEETIFHVLGKYYLLAQQYINEVDDPVGKLKNLIDLQVLLLRKNANIATLFIKNSGDIHREMLERLMAFRKKVLGLVEGIIKEGIETGVFRPVDPYLAAILFMGVVQEAGAITYKGSKISDQKLNTMLEYMINGIGN